MTRIYICDEEKKWQNEAASILKSFAEKRGAEAKITCFSTPEEVLHSKGPAPDVLFTDIEFEDGESGIDAAKEINRLYPECHIVYLAKRIEHALDVYNTKHVWYVIREQFRQRLPEIYDKVCGIDDDRKSYLVVKTTDGATVRIACRGIMYLERHDRKTFIVTYERKYVVKDRIPVILDKLPADRFARCHNSFAVNLDKVREVRPGSLVMRNGTEIMISRGYSKSFKSEYMARMESRAVK